MAFAKKRETLAKTAALTVHPPMPRVPQRPPSAAVAQRPQRHAIGQRPRPVVDVSEDEGHVISDGEPSHDDAGERKAKTRKRKRPVRSSSATRGSNSRSRSKRRCQSARGNSGERQEEQPDFVCIAFIEWRREW